MILGWLWLLTGKGSSWLKMPKNRHAEGTAKLEVFRSSMLHDFLHAGGFLVVGAAAAATLNVVVPREWLDHVAANLLLSVLVLGLLAVLLAICSEADAFVAASLTQFSLTARLAFMVVGPIVDVKLIALQAGTFGPKFASDSPRPLSWSRSCPVFSSGGGCCEAQCRGSGRRLRRRRGGAARHLQHLSALCEARHALDAARGRRHPDRARGRRRPRGHPQEACR